MNFNKLLLLAAFSFLIFSTSLYSQTRVSSNLFSIIDNDAISGLPDLTELVTDALLLELNRQELNAIYSSKPENLDLYIPVNNSEYIIVKLERFDVLTKNAKIVEMTANGEREIQPTGLLVSYRGHIAGVNNSSVVFNFTPDEILSMLFNESGNYILGKLNSGSSNHDGIYVVFNDKDLKQKNNFMCDTEDNLSDGHIHEIRNIVNGYNHDNVTLSLLEADIAFDVDFVTFNANGGSIVNTTNYILRLLTAVSTIYMKEVNVKLVSSYIRVWTTNDPYTGTTSSQILNQFRNHWNATQSAVQRTVAHLISVRSGGLGGIAWLNSLCDSPFNGYGYGFSNTSGFINQLPAYSWDVMVVSHELGHNFGSPHTHNCNAWSGGPIDTCYQPEGNCYNGPIKPRVGTIMSYCHLNAGISFILGFGQQPGALIRTRSQMAQCIGVAPEPIILGNPRGGELFRTGNVVPVYWGTSITGTINIEYSSNNGSTWETIENNVDSKVRTYNWTVPYIAYTNQALLRIYDTSNPNVFDMTDTTFSIVLDFITLQNISPPTFTAINTTAGSQSTVTFTWTSAGTHPSLSYNWSIRKGGASVNSNLYYQSNNSGLDSSFTITIGELDDLASQYGANEGDSVLALWAAWAYNGYDSVSSSTFILVLKRTPVGIQNITEEIPTEFKLYNNFPNPFNPVTNIKFDVPKHSQVLLRVFDVTGREVSSLVNDALDPGSYNFQWDASMIPSGVYFYELRTTDYRKVNRMILIK